MREYLYIIIFLFLASLSCLQAQVTVLPLQTTDEDPVLTQYGENMFYHNPAYAGYDGTGEFNFNMKNLLGFTDSSESKHYIMSLHGAVDDINSGLGATFEYYYDYRPSSNGFAKNVAKVVDWKISIAYTYSYYFNDEGNVRIGASIALANRSEYVDNFVGRQSKIYGDLGFGLWLKQKDFNLGFSMKHLNSPKIEFLSNAGLNNTTSIRPLFFMTANYDIHVNPNIIITPTMMMRYRNTSYIMTDFGVMSLLFNSVNFGFTYRMDFRSKPDQNPNNPVEYERVKILATTIGYQFNQKAQFMISFDRYLQEVYNRNRNALELTLGINFGGEEENIEP